jgi:hypothetical protein
LSRITTGVRQGASAKAKDCRPDRPKGKGQMPKFECGDTVVLRSDDSLTDMKAGDTGVVIAWYKMEPPAYEVEFRDPKGKKFDALMKEDELDFPPQRDGSAPLRR